MPDFTAYAADSYEVKENGVHSLTFRDGFKRYFSAAWTGPKGSTPAGTIAFTFDGNPGDPPAIMDLGVDPPENAFDWNTRVPKVEVEVTGLPDGGRITLYFA
jgi:hypothetical protein